MELVIKMSFSEKLAQAMKDKEMSTRQLSELTGIPKSAIQRYTSGETEKIPIDRMIRMAEAMGIDPAYVMGWASDSTAKISKALGSDSPAAKKLQEIKRGLNLYSVTDSLEMELVDIYRSLNDKGRDMLVNTARSLATNPDMR